MTSFKRRTFIVSAGLAVGAVTLQRSAGARTASDPFRLGVASGDPRQDGMVLWTRLAPRPLEVGGGMGDQPVPVQWQVAKDELFTTIVASGTETAVPVDAHSVHAEPVGLQPGAEYFYRFRADGYISPVGRTRTAPALGTNPASLTFAMASCQHFEPGYYAAHHFIAADEPDLVLFLGDYMYEHPTKQADPVRRYVQSDKINTLDEYRLRYAQTHTDRDLKAAHAVAPWLVVFDDHEVRNNWWGGSGKTGEVSDARKQAAFRAYWENMPLPKAMKPTGPEIDLYRRVGWGALARFHMMDTRQYRDRQATKGNCDWIRRPDRTLTGAKQEQWLLDGLAASDSRWDLLGQQVFFANKDGDGKPATCDGTEDGWDDYPHSRHRITQGWVDRKVRNPVVLTGDVHKHWANNLRVNYWKHDSPIVGSELVTTSVTSGSRTPTSPKPPNSPHLHYIGDPRGYVRVHLGREQLTADFMKVSTIKKRDMSQVHLSRVKRFIVDDGRPGVHAP